MKTKTILLASLAGAVGTAGVLWWWNRRGYYEPFPTPAPRGPIEYGKNVIMLAPDWGVIRVKEVPKFRRALEAIDGDVSVVIHTLGGSVLAVDHIAHMLRSRREKGDKVTAYIPNMALSGGTMIALAADEIVMEPTAILGPVDPQVDGWPAVSILQLLDRKPAERIDDEWMLMGIESAKAIAETRSSVQAMTSSEAAIERLTSGRTTHARPIAFEEARTLGLTVRKGVPPDLVLALEDALARHPRQRGCLIMPMNLAPDARTGLVITQLASPEPWDVHEESSRRNEERNHG